jgi:cysteine desulfurase
MIYLDNNSTTPIDDEVLDAMLPYLKEEYGNPSSRYYTLSVNAYKAVEKAREQVASLINAEPKEIIFTSGASESNNFIIKGIADYKKNYEGIGNHIITTTVEHKSILQSCQYLEGKVYNNKSINKTTSKFLKVNIAPKVIDRGYEVTYLPVDNNSLVNIESFKSAIKNNTILASIMWGNNETGAINAISSIADIAKENNILFHSDATQVLGKVNIDVKKLPVDFLSFSAHKVYGPKGIGAAYLRNNGLPIKITSLIHGGQQEDGYRAGTSAVHNIVGFGKACEIAKKNMCATNLHLKNLEIETKKILINNHPDIVFIANECDHIPGMLSMIIPGIVNELLIKRLSYTVALSSGSACGIGEPSYVIKELKIGDNISTNFLRLSFNKLNTIEDLSLLNLI